MKLLILAIYSDNDEYRVMRDIQRTYAHRFENVHYYFTSFREEQENDVMIEDDIVYVKGKEEYLNITYKTIKAFEFLLAKHSVDFVIRTNISTIVDIPKLILYCERLDKTPIYTGYTQNLQWLDPPAGIRDHSLRGTIYVTGTNIIISQDIAQCMVENKEKIRYDVVDDVSFGVFINKYFPGAHRRDQSIVLYSRGIIRPTILANISDAMASYVFYRNKMSEIINRVKNRAYDIQNMRTLVSWIYS